MPPEDNVPLSTSKHSTDLPPVPNAAQIQSPKPRVNKIAFVLLGVLLLLVFLMAGLWFGLKPKLKPTQKISAVVPTVQPLPHPTYTLTTSNSGSWLAYTQLKVPPDPRTDYLYGNAFVFNLDTQVRTDLGSLVSKAQTSSEVGFWSDDGRYLPVSFSEAKGQLSELYVYDLVNHQMQKVLEGVQLTTPISTHNGISDFYWDGPNKLIINLGTGDKSHNSMFSTDLSGNFQFFKSPNESSYELYKTNSLEFHFPVTSSGGLDTTGPVIFISGSQTYKFPVSGVPLGLLDKNIITQDYVFPEVIASPKPQNGTFHVYSLDSGNEISKIIVPTEGWTPLDAFIRPGRGTIVIHEYKFDTYNTVSRFVEVDPNSPYSPKELFTASDIVVETSAGQGLLSPEETFVMTADGNWIVATVVKVQDYNTKILTAWNVNTGKSVQICSSNCAIVQVYNPYRIIHMF